ncbi:hypothetical protein GCM10008013_07680 [Paenibacillus segetis]|uniref:Uncharacterized protein n=2 Tax=Paenibacillus segetis TaxID=1325360 RepID=A0ABQ1Y6X7_9BACL|nr:hypothetical protein GCM10008013_07680 [Paenibacillus segetis]
MKFKMREVSESRDRILLFFMNEMTKTQINKHPFAGGLFINRALSIEDDPSYFLQAFSFIVVIGRSQDATQK